MGLLLSLLGLLFLGILGLALCWAWGIWPFGPREPEGLHTARFATDREIRHLWSGCVDCHGVSSRRLTHGRPVGENVCRLASFHCMVRM
jgi:hypothetical protein